MNTWLRSPFDCLSVQRVPENNDCCGSNLRTERNSRLCGNWFLSKKGNGMTRSGTNERVTASIGEVVFSPYQRKDAIMFGKEAME